MASLLAASVFSWNFYRIQNFLLNLPPLYSRAASANISLGLLGGWQGCPRVSPSGVPVPARGLSCASCPWWCWAAGCCVPFLHLGFSTSAKAGLPGDILAFSLQINLASSFSSIISPVCSLLGAAALCGCGAYLEGWGPALAQAPLPPSPGVSESTSRDFACPVLSQADLLLPLFAITLTPAYCDLKVDKSPISSACAFRRKLKPLLDF